MMYYLNVSLKKGHNVELCFRQKVEGRKTKVRSYYMDATELANYWGCDSGPRRYGHSECNYNY